MTNSGRQRFPTDTSDVGFSRHLVHLVALESGFGNRAAILYAGTGGPDPVFQPIGGMMQIPLAFQRVLGDTITLNAEVRTVRQSPDGVHVSYTETRTGEEREVTGDYCLCCLPMSIVQRLDIDLSPEMSSAASLA